MSRRLQLTVLIGLLATTFADAQQTRDTRPVTAAKPPAPAGTAAIAGVATNEDGSRPVRFAYVLLIGTTTGTVKVSSTDGDGKFSFASLAADRYTIGVSKLPYIGTIAGSKRAGRPGTPIVVAAGQKVANVAVRMPMGGVIAGAITDDKGVPAASAMVALQQWQMQAGERTLVNAGQSMTDDLGRYRFHGLMPGEYLVTGVILRASLPARVLTATEVDAALRGETLAVPSPPVPPARPAPSYFPGTTRASDASPILLGAGEERQNVDFRLQSVMMSRIEGTVATSDGQPVAARVLVQSVGSVFGIVSSIATGPDGRFSFTGAPGTYALTATGTGAQQGQFAHATVEATGADVYGVQLLMRPTMSMNGQLAFEGRTTAPTLAGRRIPWRWLGMTGTPTPTGLVPSATTPAGTFTVTGLVPGRYVIGGPMGFGPTADTMTWALKSVVVDGADTTDRVFEVSADTPPKNIVVTYTDQFQELSGRLQSQSGAPVSEYTILVFPEDKAYWIHGSRRIVTARPGTDGKFTLSGAGPTTLPPGRYLLAAVTDVGRDEQFDPAFLGQVVAAAVPIALGPGEKKIQDLAIK